MEAEEAEVEEVEVEEVEVGKEVEVEKEMKKNIKNEEYQKIINVETKYLVSL